MKTIFSKKNKDRIHQVSTGYKIQPPKNDSYDTDRNDFNNVWEKDILNANSEFILMNYPTELKEIKYVKQING